MGRALCGSESPDSSVMTDEHYYDTLVLDSIKMGLDHWTVLGDLMNVSL